jgi:DNA-binding MarR family transcriptional regulator
VTDPESLEALRSLVRLARLLERASGDLSLAHYRVLAAIDDGDARASRVAARLALGKPTISATVDALCRRGLVRRAGSTDDQRATDLRISARGRAVLRSAESAMQGRLDEVLAHCEQAEVAVAALARLGAGLDAVAEQRLREQGSR